jgi:hypothetical protein
MHDTISLQRFSSRERYTESSECDPERKTSVPAEHSLQAVNVVKITYSVVAFYANFK